MFGNVIFRNANEYQLKNIQNLKFFNNNRNKTLKLYFMQYGIRYTLFICVSKYYIFLWYSTVIRYNFMHSLGITGNIICTCTKIPL